MKRMTLFALIACQACKHPQSGTDAASDADITSDAMMQFDAVMAHDGALGDALLCPDAVASSDAIPDASQPPGLALVSARDHIEGFFLTHRTITADATRIYLASRGNNKLFVLARDRTANFPLLQTVTVGAHGMSSVEADATHVRVISILGDVFVYAKERC